MRSLNTKYKIFGSLGKIVAFFPMLLVFTAIQKAHSQDPLLLKIAVKENGVYRITYKQLQEYGFKDPQNVGVFGYGGALLSEKLSESPREMLPAVPTLHLNEAIYFYAQGPLSIYYDWAKKGLRHRENHYAVEGFYFLSESLPKKEIETLPINQETPTLKSNTYDAYYHYEKELLSLKQSGRLIVGETLSNGTTYHFNLKTSKDALDNKPSKLSVAYVSLPAVQGKLHFKSNNKILLEDEIKRSEETTPENYLKGIYHFCTTEIQSSVSKVFPFDISFSPASEKAYLDFVSISTTNQLSYSDGVQFVFRKVTKKNQLTQFTFSEIPTDMRIWQILSPNNIQEITLDKDNSFRANSQKKNEQPTEFIAFRPSDSYTPRIVGKTSLKNIRNYEATPDLIIITPNLFYPEAERLATFHREIGSKKVLVLTDEEVYNEFSSGTPDATAYRLLCKSFYDRWKKQNTNKKNLDQCPIHLLLFGDGAADNRLISHEWNALKKSGVEMLLTYESKNSLNVDSFVADDYFGLVSEGEDHLHIGAKTLSIAIGRFTIRSLYEAKAIVDKCIAYGTNKQTGDWKLNSTIVADDGDYFNHLKSAEGLASVIKKQIPEMIIGKVYFDAFPKETLNGLTTFPAAKKKLFDSLEKGMLILNYTGHGNPYAWSNEQILTLGDIQRFDYSKLPLWITATCDFANFDHPITSAGEAAFLNPTSGAIGLLTTSRVVYDIYNQQINEAFLESLFTLDEKNQYPTFGKALMRAKNRLKNSSDEGGLINKLHFFFIGDPLLTLNLPTYKATIERINGEEINPHNQIKLHALDKVKLEGSIRNSHNEIDGNFTGTMAVTIFDSESEVKTLEANRPEGLEHDATYKDYRGLIYAGTTSVKEGFFEINFTIPKDLSYKGGATRINLYAYDDKGKNEAMGVNLSSTITSGGEDKKEDTTPPEIRKLFLNDSTAVDHFLTGPTPIFYTEIFDKSGINLSSEGLGHLITLSIDGRSDYTFTLNDYYKVSPLEAGVGSITYTLPQIEEGDHIATFSVWDVYNNCTEKKFHFRVNTQRETHLMLSKLYPNPIPLGQPLSLEIITNTPGELFDAYAELIDFTGRVVARSDSFTFKSSLFAPATYSFIPTTSYGTLPLEGLYFVRITAKGANGRSLSTTQKLVIYKQQSSKK